MDHVISITRENLNGLIVREPKWDSFDEFFDERYPQHLRGKNLDFEFPLVRGTLPVVEINDDLPNGKIRDVVQPRLNFVNWTSLEDEHAIIRASIRDTLRGELGKQVYSIKFYQVPAPKSTQAHTEKRRMYLEEVFKAQDVISDDEWIREPQILIESGSNETILADSTDAEWVADIYPELKEKYADIGFLVDFTESVDPEAFVKELPDGSVKKLRVNSLNAEVPGEVGDDICKSLII